MFLSSPGLKSLQLSAYADCCSRYANTKSGISAVKPRRGFFCSMLFASVLPDASCRAAAKHGRKRPAREITVSFVSPVAVNDAPDSSWTAELVTLATAGLTNT